MRKTIGEQLAALRARSGLSLAEIARLAGYKGASSLQRYFSPDYDPEVLDYRTAQKLAEAMEGAGTPPIEQYDLMALTAAADQTGFRTPFPLIQTNQEMKGIIPVYDTASTLTKSIVESKQRSVEIIRINMDDPVEYRRCPPVLERRDVFGIYVGGTAMRPRFNPGEIVFTDGRKPPTLGDDVLVILADEPEEDGDIRAVMGYLHDYTDQNLVLKQYAAGTFEIPLERVVRARRVMAPIELLSGFIV